MKKNISTTVMKTVLDLDGGVVAEGPLKTTEASLRVLDGASCERSTTPAR